MKVLPHVREALVDDKRRCTPAFYQFLRALSESANLDLAAQVEAIARALGSPDGSVDNIPPQTAGEFLSSATRLLGNHSVQVYGTLEGGLASVALVGDTSEPAPTAYYGTDSDGNKTFHPVADAFTAGEGIALAVDAGGVTEIGLADLPDTGAGALLAITRDGKGRVSGSRVATTDDLSEGATNLYYTDTRADARVNAGIAAHEAESNPHPQYLLAASAPIDGGNFADTFTGSAFAVDGGSF
jgi:hypothetical protein